MSTTTLLRAAGNVVDWFTGFSPVLSQSFRRLRGGDALGALFNQLNVGLVEVRLDGSIGAANSRFGGLVERGPEALANLRMQDLMDAADVTGYQDAMANLASGSGPFVCEAQLLTLDRRALWVEIAASPLSAEGAPPTSAALVVLDISRRKSADARASESARRFREVADAAPVYIWTSGTDRRRRHTWVNTRWADFRGQPMEDELGSGWTLGVHADDLENCLSAYSLAFDRRGPFTVEYRLRRFDGEHRWMLDTGAPINDDHGRFVGYIGSLLDITERKETEAEREALLAAERAARSEAEHTNQLKDEFLSVLSHELRTPLNAVLGWVHLLQTSVGHAGDIGHGLTVIERNARLQSRMIDDLLDMGGVMAGQMQLDLRPVALDQVIDSALESLKPQFDAKPVSVHKLLDRETAPIQGDLGRLQQIVWNLLSNALKFTPAGGQVVVELQQQADGVQVVVRDTGHGIDPAFLPFVFERFRQSDGSTRRSHGGLGIGLALVKSLAELHGGVVAAESDGTGRGATFTVTLPRGRAAARQEPAAESSLLPQHSGGSSDRAVTNLGGRI